MDWLSPKTVLWTAAAAAPLAYYWLSSSPVGLPQRSLYGVPVTPKLDGQSPIYRSFRTAANTELPDSFPGAATIYDAFQLASSRFAEKNCMGYRKVVNIVKEDVVVKGQTKTWEYSQLGPYEWFTYSQVVTKANHFGSGLRQMGLSKGANFAIYLDTRPEWRLAALGCHSQSITVLTIYANLGRDGLVHGLNEGEVTHVLTSASNIPNLAKMAGNKTCPKLRTVVYTDELTDEAKAAALKLLDVNFISYDEVERMGREKTIPAVLPGADDLALIMYTSGTTGLPKGVMISHRNVMASAASLTADGKVDHNDVTLSILPLAHILAFTLETACYALGLSIGYGSPRTLSDAMVRKCRGDLPELKPTLFIGVPTLFDRIKQGILDKLEKSSPTKRRIFDIAFESKRKAMQQNQATPLWDLLVFKQFKEAMGGRLRFTVCGGAPISFEAQEFLQTCFGVPFLEGYGLTETCGIATGKELSQRSLGNCGGNFPACEIKLVDVPEMKYFASDLPNPRGEIWVRGANVSKGYYKNPEKTAEDFDLKEGWFKTGDVGMFNPDGTLSIIDRKKNLVKPPHGEYIAVEKLESIFKNSLFVSNICVHADSHHNDLIALIFPNKKYCEEFAEKNGIPAADWASLCKDEKLKEAILKDLQREGQKTQLRSMEMISAVLLYPDEWTPENDWLTSAMKLRRFDIKIKQKAAVEEAYVILEKKQKGQ